MSALTKLSAECHQSIKVKMFKTIKPLLINNCLSISTIATLRLLNLMASPMPGGTTKTEIRNTFGPAATTASTPVSAASMGIALTLRWNAIATRRPQSS
jgi:hypothetical protein